MKSWSVVFPLLCCVALAAGNAVAGDEQTPVNPDFFYFHAGDTPGDWQWVLADKGNWWQPLTGNSGVSGSGKLTIEPVDSKEFGTAVRLEWSKAERLGRASIGGRSVDLSAFEQRGELMVALKLETRTHKDVSVKLSCGDKCEAQVPILANLKKAPLNQWFVLPIALDCFTLQGATLKNVSSPFSIETEGRLVLQIGEVSIRAMAAGDQGCVPDQPAAAPAQKPDVE